MIRINHDASGRWNRVNDEIGDECLKFLQTSQGGLCSLLTLTSLTLGKRGIDMFTLPPLRRGKTGASSSEMTRYIGHNYCV